MTAEEFLDVFFGPGNRLSRDHVAARPRLQGLVGALDRGFDEPVVLPRMATDSLQITWYLLAFDDDAFRRAAEEIRGSIGPTYARWEPRHPIPSDVIEDAVRAVSAGRTLRFFTEGPEEFEALWTPLARLLALWSQRPGRQASTLRGLHRLLQDIEMRLAAGDGDGALRDLTELRSRGIISIENARFIEVRALAAQRRWRELLAHEDVPDLRRMRRPWLVTEALITAHYEVWLRPHENEKDVDGALVAYRQHEEDLAPLLRVRGPLRSAPVVKTHLLHGVATHTPGAALVELRSLLETDADRAWADLLLGQASDAHEQPQDPQVAFRSGAFDVAFLTAMQAAERDKLVDLILESGAQLRTLEAAKPALDFWRGLSEADREHAQQRAVVRDAVVTLESLTATPEGTPIPSTWHAWLERIVADPDWPAAAAIARCGELEFDAQDAVDERALSRLVELISEAAGSAAASTLLQGIPALLSWLDRSGAPEASGVLVRSAVLQALALMDGWEAAGLEIAADLVNRILEAGPSPATYADLLDSVDLIWQRMASRRHAAWFADVVEQLEFHPGDRAALIGLFSAGAGRLSGERLTDDVREGLSLVSHALGADIEFARSEEAVTESTFSGTGRRIGIYSLSPQVAARARDRLRGKYQGLEVVHREDKVETDGLVAMVRSVDLLVVAIGSAKHAATGAIDARRPPNKPTLRHSFRGSTRIVEAVETGGSRTACSRETSTAYPSGSDRAVAQPRPLLTTLPLASKACNSAATAAVLVPNSNARSDARDPGAAAILSAIAVPRSSLVLPGTSRSSARSAPRMAARSASSSPSLA